MLPRDPVIPRGLFPNDDGSLPPWRGRQRHPVTTRLGESDRDHLLRRASAVLALADVVDLLTHELACLRARRFALALVGGSALAGLLV